MPAGSTACATLARAYALASAGDIIGVATGDYGGQTICRDGSSCSNAASKGSPAIVFGCATRLGCTINGYLRLGTNNGSAAGAAPSYVTFDGFVVAQGKVVTWGPSGVTDKGSHITFENGHIWDLSNRSSEAPSNPGDDWAGFEIIEQSDLSVLNTEIGPICCSADGIQNGVLDTSIGSNVTLSGNYIHDLYDNCAAVPASVTNAYGSCTGYGFGNGDGAHVDGMHIWGGVNGLTITGNRIYGVGNAGNASGQGIFIERDPLGINVTFSNVLIADNMVNMGVNGTNAVSFSPNGGTAGATGFLKILYNTVWASGASQYGNIRIYSGFMAPGATVVVAGNISRTYATSVNTCSLTAQGGSSLTVIYANNLFGDRTCSASDRMGTPSLVSTAEGSPDLHLSGAQAAINGGESTYCPATDIDGRARPAGGACDIGADEAG
jgi:hypothetical protein